MYIVDRQDQGPTTLQWRTQLILASPDALQRMAPFNPKWSAEVHSQGLHPRASSAAHHQFPVFTVRLTSVSAVVTQSVTLL